MLTPLNPLFLINSRNTMIWRSFYNIGILIMTVFCGIKAGIVFNLSNIIRFIISMLSSSALLFAIYLNVCALSFKIIDIQVVQELLNEFVKKYMVYPIHIYGKITVFLFTFILPLGFIAYYPSVLMLNKAEGLLFNPTLAMLTPVFALFWLVVAWLVWRYSVKGYNSTGT